MNIKVKIHGHQHYSEYTGRVLGWVQTVENFQSGNDDKFLQVPAVIIKTKGGISIVSLRQHLYWSEIDLMDDMVTRSERALDYIQRMVDKIKGWRWRQVKNEAGNNEHS